MSDYCLKFKYNCESEYWNIPIRKAKLEEAIKEAMEILKDTDIFIEDAYLTEIKEKKVWNYKGEQQ